MDNTFYCGSCGEHKADSLLSRRTASGRKICKGCDARREERDKKRQAPSKFFGGNAIGADDDKHAKKRAQDRYKKGKLPNFMYS